ncbi:hypothetical protein LINPERPRIM_LOCUS16584 [Linum perenne]
MTSLASFPTNPIPFLPSATSSPTHCFRNYTLLSRALPSTYHLRFTNLAAAAAAAAASFKVSSASSSPSSSFRSEFIFSETLFPEKG